ncbi:MAG: universal stress protein [Candidatus Palauibacterales bacterium]|nr:universal stress protein [Candidatus Palauibacterales bacterium]MDP2481677.1 universal stress protein [Candidatus Palauibacterales bacterium]
MFDHVLIALDGSEEARSAALLGLRVAGRLEARVTGISVIDVRVVEGPAVETLSPLWGEVTGRPFQPELMRLYRDRAEAALDDFCATAEKLGVGPIERYAEIGVAEDVILDRAGAADLLVMGRKGEHGGIGRRNLGATLWRVLHRAPCPVLVASETNRGEGADGRELEAADVPERPLLAWEPGAGSAAALDLALEYCRAVGAGLKIVHAGDESHDVHLEEMCALLADAGVTWESARLAEQPADAVAEARRRWEADCLFMGAFGRGRVRDFLFGSNTVEILERMPVPVFVCR